MLLGMRSLARYHFYLEVTKTMHASPLVQLFRATAPQVIDPSAQRASAAPCSRRGFAYVAILLAACVTIVSTPAFAQTQATIAGVLTDPSGAGVPGASLTLTNQDTAVVLPTQQSDASGNFSFQAVPAPVPTLLPFRPVVSRGSNKKQRHLLARRPLDHRHHAHRHPGRSIQNSRDGGC